MSRCIAIWDSPLPCFYCNVLGISFIIPRSISWSEMVFLICIVWAICIWQMNWNRSMSIKLKIDNRWKQKIVFVFNKDYFLLKNSIATKLGVLVARLPDGTEVECDNTNCWWQINSSQFNIILLMWSDDISNTWNLKISCAHFANIEEKMLVYC